MTKEVRPKRVAVVVPKYGLVGGGEKFVYELTERIATDPRWEIHVFANKWRKGSDLIKFHHVSILRFPRFLSLLSFAYFAREKINRLGVDLIHAHERILHADLYTAHGIPHRTWIRDVRRKHPSLFDLSTMWIESRLLNSDKCRAILPVSTLARDRLVAAFPTIAHKTKVLLPGVDATPFEELDRHRCRSMIRKQYGIADSDSVLLFVGMNFEVKGLESIIEAVARLKRHDAGKAVKLLVVGKGDEKRYRAIARKLGVCDDIIFTGVWRQEIAPVYLSSDLFIMLSTFDTFGLTVLEAMAAGLPVIVSSSVGACDVVRNGENGYIVNPLDPDEVSRCMLQILDPNRFEDMAQSARETAMTHTWSAMAQKVAEIYNEMLFSAGSENDRERGKSNT